MSIRILSVFILFAFTQSYSFEFSRNDSVVSYGMDLCISEEYDRALAVFDSMQTIQPNSPIGYFLAAAVIQSKMLDFETIIGSAEFYTQINKAIQLAQQWTKDEPNNADAWFYRGAARSYYSYQLAREKKYLRAITSGLDSIDDLKKSLKLDSTMCDALLGIGSYEYWRSYLTRKFAWLPFFSDQRQQGIEKMQSAIECGSFTRWAAISNLAWAFIEEERYKDAINISLQGLEHFPNSRFFLWPLADALYRNGEYWQAMETYQRILESSLNESYNNHYNEIVLNYKLGQCCYELGNYKRAKEYLQTAINLQPAKEVEKRGQDKHKDAKELLAKLYKEQN